MSDPSSEALKKQINYELREIEAIEDEIAQCDDSKTYPPDYAIMRSKQEKHRQEALKCKASLDEKT